MDDDAGRDYDGFRKTVMVYAPGSEQVNLDEFVGTMAGYARLGVHTAIVTPATGAPAAWIDAM